jgi:hypothetical protein
METVSDDSSVQITSLELGIPLPWDVYDARGKLIMRAGTRVTDMSKAMLLVEKGIYRYLTEDEILDRDGGPRLTARGRFVDPAIVYDKVQQLRTELAAFYTSFLAGAPELPGVPLIVQMARDIDEVCDENPDLALAFLQLSEADGNAVTQSLQCAVICDLLLRKCAVKGSERLAVVRAALTKDLGMLEMMPMLHVQREPLRDEQWVAIKRHPVRSVEILQNFGVKDPIWLDAVMTHHERLDGSGYPRGLKEADITISARVIAIADIYTAMIKPRAYREAVLAKDALREIFVARGQKVDNELTQVFIKELGIFPPGALVRLANGEIAVVVARGVNTAYPMCRAIVGPRGAEYDEPRRRDTAVDRLHAIKEMLPPREYQTLVLSFGAKLWGGRH